MSHQRYEPMSLWSCGCALAPVLNAVAFPLSARGKQNTLAHSGFAVN
uniref:Uncharacterized protein n=1 Tax=Anguilla anguilla TaxID=7936 RepID=A0A0E9SSW2_ANGAN